MKSCRLSIISSIIIEGIVTSTWAEKKRNSEGFGPVMKQIVLLLKGNARALCCPNEEYDSESAEEGHGQR
jgi:hypothetical protein